MNFEDDGHLCCELAGWQLCGRLAALEGELESAVEVGTGARVACEMRGSARLKGLVEAKLRHFYASVEYF